MGSSKDRYRLTLVGRRLHGEVEKIRGSYNLRWIGFRGNLPIESFLISTING